MMEDRKVLDCLNENTGSYIFPLVWYAGEDRMLLEKEIRAVKAGGIDEFVLENRGGNWFCRAPWWDIMDTALETAKELNMRMWLLDDSHVNTGSANDSMKNPENSGLRAVNLRMEVADFVGPVKDGALILPNHTECEQIIQISAYRRDENTGVCIGAPVDLTDRVMDGLCAVDLPDGIWRVCFILTADPSRQGMFAEYITMVSQASCRHLIDEVHEKIYARYSQYFGNVFAGFFSDEPAFGNCDGQYGYDSCDHRMGQLRRLYPWQKDFPRKIAESAGMTEAEAMANLPALWNDVSGRSPRLRIAYMDVITRAWRENFSRQIGRWCEEHGVEYIGHCLEDHAAHMHTGWGCGHYFRAMAGQHMAGLDIVLNQYVPGFRTIPHTANSSIKEYHSEFYNYTLPKLGASLAHITPHMKNRVFCEVFGGYGWTCGLSMMQAIFNLFLANGTNHFMPHAFSMKLPGDRREPDKDSIVPPGYCMEKLPPTFYMGGLNPQYRLFHRLMQYVRRCCHLLSDGVHQADVAVFYNAEADWINSRFQNLDEVSMILTRGGWDYDYLPSDTLYSDCGMENGKLRVHEEQYGAIVIPYSEILPQKLLSRLDEIAAAGVKVIFCDGLPTRCEHDSTNISPLLERFSIIPSSGLAGAMAEFLSPQWIADRPTDALRGYRLVRKDGSECRLFFNDGIETIDTPVWFPDANRMVFYDAWQNQLLAPKIRDGKIRLHLKRQQLVILVLGKSGKLPQFDYEDQVMQELPLRYDIFIREAGNSEFRLLRANSLPVNLLTEEKLSRCCAEFRYDGRFETDDPTSTVLEIPNAGDGAELWINDIYCGAAVGPVCRFDIRNKLRTGENTLSIRTADNPSYSDRKVSRGIVYGTKLPAMTHGFTGHIRLGKQQ